MLKFKRKFRRQKVNIDIQRKIRGEETQISNKEQIKSQRISRRTPHRDNWLWVGCTSAGSVRRPVTPISKMKSFWCTQRRHTRQLLV